MHSAFIEKPPNRLFLEYQLHFCAIYGYAEHKDAFLGFRGKCSQYPNKLLLSYYRIFPSNKLVYYFLVTEFGVPVFGGGAPSWELFVIGDDEKFQFDTFPFPCRSGPCPKNDKVSVSEKEERKHEYG